MKLTSLDTIMAFSYGVAIPHIHKFLGLTVWPVLFFFLIVPMQVSFPGSLVETKCTVRQFQLRSFPESIETLPSGKHLQFANLKMTIEIVVLPIKIKT